MAKKHKRRKKNKKQGAGGGGGVFGEDLVREILGNFVGNLMSDGLVAAAAAKFGSRNGTGNGDRQQADSSPRDLAAEVLRVLAEQGPKPVSELVELTGAGLSPLLEALGTARDFRLVEFVEEGSVAQLTDAGNRTVTVLRKDDIREQAQRLLSAGAE
jgi:hypothetical protein